MATGNIAPVDSIGNLSSLLGLLKGKSSTSTSTTNMSSEGMTKLLQNILGSTQGLASVASGQKTAGMYGSTVNQQMINDLLTRASGEVASKSSTTTTSNRTPAALGGKNILDALLLSQSTKLLGPTLKKVGNPFETAGNSLADAIFGSSSAAAPLSAEAFASNVGMSLGADAGIGSALGVDWGLGTLGVNLGAEAGASFLAEAGASFGGEALAATALEAAGSSAAAAAATTAIEAAATEAGIAEAIPAAIALWVICTELNARGYLDNKLYSASAMHALTLPANVLRGYHWWAVPFTRKLRNSPRLAKWITPLVKSRCNYLLTDSKKYFFGYLTVVLGERVCALIGDMVKVVPNWEDLYGDA